MLPFNVVITDMDVRRPHLQIGNASSGHRGFEADREDAVAASLGGSSRKLVGR
jgi:hypothetical protein